MVLGQTDMSSWKYKNNTGKCLQEPYSDVLSAQWPVNSILYTGEILTGLTGASTGYIII
jgi:hypothetical protein